ncbi:sensor histidine kinase [Flavivirga eckloniae]|uniref:histidine kinase n=1 Tax=Flavivirga eckloniae TaxID=1803846 RepID=A0A2K9PK08_9FLAO|nr:ATP-binding protein [Flavivirga eckloniae]AUP77372.1 hypothetical protein C1H87_01005 [Flavivirga eckloniae]
MEHWQNPKVIAFWLWIIVLIFMLMAVFISFLVRNYVFQIKKEEQKNNELRLNIQKDLLLNSIETQEKERTRIAEELHDNFISQLNIIRLMNANNYENDIINNKIVECIKAVRKMSHELTPPFLNTISLEELMAEHIQPLNQSFSVDFFSNLLVQLDLVAHIKLQVLRIFQEIITNIIKHANATVIKVFLRISKKWLTLQVVDNGIGFNSNIRKGMGLKNIESRAQILQADFRFNAPYSKGTSFIICINLEKLNNESR